MTLRDLKIGRTAKIVSVGGQGALRQHFLDMGVIPGTEITLNKFAPLGDPMQLQVQGYELTLRLADAENIEVVPCEKQTENSSESEFVIEQEYRHEVEHPGLGEEGRFHCKKTEHPLPKETRLTFALVGNQNSGKTTLFNQLTGMNQHVGNFPGVTVDQKIGTIKGHPKASVADLPGIYSLSPYTTEEIVSRDFILKMKPTGIINIVDATNIERNLYLTMQLMELDIPIVLALNMMDEVRNNGGTIRINKMEDLLGIPVIPISAMKNEGVDELVTHAIHIAKYQEGPGRQDFCSPEDHGGAVHRCLHAIMHLIEDHAEAAGIPIRFAASKLVEGDKLIRDALKLSENESELLAHILKQLEQERGLDPSAAIADMRFDYIRKVCSRTVVKPEESIEHKRSRRIDSILTGKYTAIPAFIGIMFLIFWLTFEVIGGGLQELLEDWIADFTDYTDKLLTSWNIADVVHSLIINGVYAGVGTVITFLPIIVTLFFFLSLLEDSGYMARIAFVMDKFMRKLGLSGRSIVPLLMGFGCSVPSVMASRTLPSERDRKLTVMLIPFMSCTAKLPIYAFLTAAFFPRNATLVMVFLYFLGIFVSIFLATFLKKTFFKGEAVPFVMELPNYRMPGVKSVARLLWDKSKDFMQRAFSVIFIATIVIWFLQTFDFRMQLVADSQNSILANIADILTPLFQPIGLGDWKVVTSLISGFMAKESVVSTMTVLFGSQAGLQEVLNAAMAFSLLVFCLLYTPCVATIATVRREMGGRYATILVVWQCAIAWLVALIAYHLIKLFI
ncbi:ferrous iron transport protein B [Phocaeicola oris]|uniref:ferrous iron transport protein B n=1 Tax=Phocaeicola oris TaxID=2896850 RepID=UPI00234ECCDA|nr:ferrous iron transport protein B [Phocaeicola oris]MCE2617609.1 ferrous iron transport protein B [Phocaeicola oris]